MILQRNAHGLGHRIQSMLSLMRQQNPGNTNRIHIGQIAGQVLPGRIFQNKAHIKIGIVRHQNGSLTELQKFRQDRLDHRSVHHHFIVDAGQLLDFKRNRHIGIDKGGIAVCDRSVFHPYCSDLDNPVFHRRKSRRLDIKNHKAPVQILPLAVFDDLPQIIDQISLHSVNDLKEIIGIRILFPRFLAFCLLGLPKILPYMIGIRESLCHAMICDRNGRMAPFISSLYDILCLGYAVHIAHLGMTMKFHTLTRAVVVSGGCKIRYLLDARHRTDRQFIVKPVHHRNALQLDKGSRLNLLGNFCHLIVSGKHLDRNRIGKIGHIKD